MEQEQINCNGKIVLDALDHFKKPVTLRDIISFIAKQSGLAPKVIKETVVETIKGGVKHGFISRLKGNKYVKTKDVYSEECVCCSYCGDCRDAGEDYFADDGGSTSDDEASPTPSKVAPPRKRRYTHRVPKKRKQRAYSSSSSESECNASRIPRKLTKRSQSSGGKSLSDHVSKGTSETCAKKASENFSQHSISSDMRDSAKLCKSASASGAVGSSAPTEDDGIATHNMRCHSKPAKRR